jgi:hypothetical protein
MVQKSADFVPRYQKFESISLQQRVVCEPDFRDYGWEISAGYRLNATFGEEADDRPRMASRRCLRSGSVGRGAARR